MIVGRVAERAAVQSALGESRLVTITGPPGIGKSRLAAAVAASAAPGFAYADLAPARPDCLAEAVAAPLGVTERPGQPLEQALHERLGAGRCLLVLDGCESRSGMGGLVGRLLDACPGLAVLATAQSDLGVAGERVVPVPPLAPADAAALLRERSGRDEAAGELCARLGGVPLAIELAAARAGTPSALPASGLSRVIDWTCRLLDPSDQRLLRQRSVFVGGFDWQPGALADVGLAAPAGEGRWRLPRPVRAYALDRLRESGEEPDARRAHLEWAAATAAELRRRLEAGEPWRARFDQVADDLRAALDATTASGSAAHDLARALGWLCYARRFLREARRRFRQAAGRAPGDGEAAADLRLAAAVALAEHRGEAAFQLLLASAERAAAAGDAAARAIALAEAVCAGSRFPATFEREVPHERLVGLQEEAGRAAPDDPLVAAHLAAAAAWNATGQKTVPDPALAWAALRAARAVGDPVLVMGALDAVMCGEGAAGRFRETRRLGGERLERLAALPRHDPRTGVEVIDTLHVAPLAAIAAGDLEGAVAAAAVASGDPFSGRYMGASKHVVPLFLCGRFDEALERAAAMWEAWSAAGRPAARWMAPAARAAALTFGLRGRTAEHAEWLRRADDLAAPRGRGHISDSFAAFADSRLALHLGALDEAVARALDLPAMPAWPEVAHLFYDTCAWAVAAEVAVVAGLPDAGDRLAAAGPAGDESAWAAACLLRARGRLCGDREALRAALAGWQRIGARFEAACTMLLLPDRRVEGSSELAALGCRPPAP